MKSSKKRHIAFGQIVSGDIDRSVYIRSLEAERRYRLTCEGCTKLFLRQTLNARSPFYGIQIEIKQKAIVQTMLKC